MFNYEYFIQHIDFLFWISCWTMLIWYPHKSYFILVLRDPITDNIFSSDKRLLLCVTISPLEWRRQGIILIARRIPRVQYDRLKTKCLFLVALPAAVPPTTYPYFGPLMDLNFPSRPIHRPSHGLRSSFEHKPNPSWCLFWVEVKGVSPYCFYLLRTDFLKRFDVSLDLNQRGQLCWFVTQTAFFHPLPLSSQSEAQTDRGLLESISKASWRPFSPSCQLAEPLLWTFSARRKRSGCARSNSSRMLSVVM